MALQRRGQRGFYLRLVLYEERDTIFPKFVGGPNAREHEELWGSECAATDDNFFVGFEDLT